MAKKKHSQLHEVTAFGAGAFGAKAASADTAASDALWEGMARFLEESGKKTPKDKLKGNLFEYIVEARINEQAALTGSKATARTTAADGRSHDAADIEILKNGKVVKEIQVKVSDPDPSKTSPSEVVKNMARRLAKQKYHGMVRQVPSDKADQIREFAKNKAKELEARGDPSAKYWEDVAKRTTGKHAPTTKELKSATEHPERFVALEKGRALVREAGNAGLHAAGAAALLDGIFSTIRNTLAYSKGKIKGKEAAANIVADAGKSGVRGGLTGATGVIIRHGAKKAGLRTLARPNATTAVAASLIETGVIVYGYTMGEISAGDAAERIGSSGCSTLASIYTGAAAGAVFGPAGAVVGSIAGYMVTTSVYQSCIAIMRNARLVKEEADRVIALCEQAVRSLDQQRESFEATLNEHLNERQARFDGFFKGIDEALAADRTDDAILALSGLVASYGRDLRLVEFGEFDEFMIDSDTSLTF